MCATLSIKTSHWKQMAMLVSCSYRCLDWNKKEIVWNEFLQHGDTWNWNFRGWLMGNLTRWCCEGATTRRMHSFLSEHATPVICIGNLQPAQSSGLLQSHTLMERCRGELLGWSRREKKKMEHFPGCLNNPPRWDATAGSPRLRREREGEKKEGVGVRERSRARQKEKEMVRNEERGMEREPLCSDLIPNRLCASAHCHDIQAGEMWLSSRSSPNLLPMCDGKNN